ncbi:SDR family oxidoreductase [Rhodospirillaceae bacterium SYSU D60014]|uniref:SDR family NAD(P)-dependent oxidoreductase n=1 Tax=Virgifigura deserti TaxID=2268457 RepID=UPI000E6759EF
MAEARLGRLAGLTALIYGGGSGLGLASAQAMLDEGAQIVLSGRSADRLRQATDRLQPRQRVVAIAGDATKEEEADWITRKSIEAFGHLDALLVSSGRTATGSVFDATLEEFLDVIHVNLLCLFLAAKHAAPYLKRSDNGSITAIASISGTVGIPGRAAYSAAKAGQIGMVRSLAMDFAPYNVRVNAISPSLVLTDYAKSVIAKEVDSDAVLQRRTAAHPLGRLGQPEEIGAAAVYLASRDAAWITGQNLVIDGGLTTP